MADIVRTVKNGGYCMMSNFHLTDRRLSWKAKGLLSTLLALSGEYTMGEVVHLACDEKITGEGLAELERYGYLRQLSLNGSEEYTVYEKPFTKESSQDPALELPSAEDMPGRVLSPEENKEEEQISLRKRLELERAAEKCSENFVEAVFRELCRRDAEFRQIMTARAFEAVCLSIWERQHSGPIHTLSGLINMYLDNIVLGIRTASGGNEPMDQKEMIDISSPCGYDRGK